MARVIDAYALAESLAQRCEGAHPYQDEWRAKCPNHQGKSDTSLSLTPHDDRVLIYCHGGCTQQDVVRALGLSMADLFVPQPSAASNGHKRIVQVYKYYDVNGNLVHEAVRYGPKDFRQRRPAPAKPGEYIWSLKGIEPVLYHLPLVLAAVQRGETIYLVEGEKDVDTLLSLGVTATSNPMGACKWRKSYSEALRGAHVVIFPDNDAVGRKHADLVARSLHGIAASLKIVHLPDLSEHGDVSDWLRQDHTQGELEALVQDAPQ